MVGQNWRSRPLGDPLILGWDSRRQMSPASSEGIVPFRDNDQEVRRRAVSIRDAIKQVARDGQTNREAESRSRVPGFRNLERTQSVQTGSCYCEPVWWSAIRRFWTNKISR